MNTLKILKILSYLGKLAGFIAAQSREAEGQANHRACSNRTRAGFPSADFQRNPA